MTPPLRIVTQSVADGQEVTGLVLWRVEVSGKPARVEFLIDGVVRGTDVAAPLHVRLELRRGDAGNAPAHRPGDRQEAGRGHGHGDGAGTPRLRR